MVLECIKQSLAQWAYFNNQLTTICSIEIRIENYRVQNRNDFDSTNQFEF